MVQVISDAFGDIPAGLEFPGIPNSIPWTASGGGGGAPCGLADLLHRVQPENPSWRGKLGAPGGGV